jgi:hypothetical protein
MFATWLDTDAQRAKTAAGPKRGERSMPAVPMKRFKITAELVT